MRTGLLVIAFAILSATVNAQVTQLNSNKSLDFGIQLSATKAIMESQVDKTLWVTDGTGAGTFQLSSTITYDGGGGYLLNGKFIFAGTSAATGEELFITDGTKAGTIVLKDIIPGASGSTPDNDFALLNGFVYFTAVTTANGREVWRTDGTTVGTTLVKDIIPGTTSSNDPNDYDLFSNGSFLLFNARTTTNGVELYKSDGTAAGTALLKDINPGAPTSDAGGFFKYNNIVLFTAKTATNGIELWKTNGTTAGTIMVKDINAGAGNSITIAFFYLFNGKAYFTADNGINGGEIWSTDGTASNTKMLKDIMPGIVGSFANILVSVKIGNKIIFPAMDMTSGMELWESDGTEAGTKLFKDIVPGTDGALPFPLPAYNFDYSNGTYTQPLFQGNKFFLLANTPANGSELWISDGTAAGTKLVKDINTGTEDGIVSAAYFYTSSGLYFAADNGSKGNELWKSDGTAAGTTLVADINTGIEGSEISFGMVVNNKLIFRATNGDDNNTSDLYAVNGSFSPLPITFADFTVTAKQADAFIQWSTLTEVNTKEFTIQRSVDGVEFANIITVAAAGSSVEKRHYSYTDFGIMNSQKSIAYYRLLTTDKDGKTSYSKVISIVLKAGTGWGLQIVENPVKHDVKLSVTGTRDVLKVSVKDIGGKTVSAAVTVTGNGLITIPASSFQPGVYLVIAENGAEKKAVRFVKQ
jgi:ELWxxDGT repeat protein